MKKPGQPEGVMMGSGLGLKTCIFLFIANMFAMGLAYKSFATEPMLIAVDGDTVKDTRTVFRLLHYDTPEIQHALCDKERELGQKAKLRMQQIIIEGDYRIVSSHKKDRYGRTLATMYSHNVPTDKIFINEGLGVPYEGRGQRKDWCK